jgi:hypothetical protein
MTMRAFRFLHDWTAANVSSLPRMDDWHIELPQLLEQLLADAKRAGLLREDLEAEEPDLGAFIERIYLSADDPGTEMP